jgi:hypothetical protein
MIFRFSLQRSRLFVEGVDKISLRTVGAARLKFGTGGTYGARQTHLCYHYKRTAPPERKEVVEGFELKRG